MPHKKKKKEDNVVLSDRSPVMLTVASGNTYTYIAYLNIIIYLA